MVAEEEERSVERPLYGQIKEGDAINGHRAQPDGLRRVRRSGRSRCACCTSSDIAWGRINKPADVLSVGQQVEVKVLKLGSEGDKRRISVGLKQLQAHPWDAVGRNYKAGDRVRGTVTRLMEFGAFVELETGIEGLIHISEMSWSRGKIRKASDVVKPGETVEVVILGMNTAERRIVAWPEAGARRSLGRRAAALSRLASKSKVRSPVLRSSARSCRCSEGIEGMVHVSEISAEKRINQPADVLRVGQVVKALVLAIDPEKRQMR